MDGRRLRSVVGSTLAIISSFVLLIVGVPWARAGDLEAKYTNIVPPLFQFGQRGAGRTQGASLRGESDGRSSGGIRSYRPLPAVNWAVRRRAGGVLISQRDRD